MRQHSLPFGVFVGTLVGLNPMVYIFGTNITYPAIGMLLVIVGRRWADARLVLGNGGDPRHRLVWILCAVAFGIPVPPATFVSQMLKANALAIVLNVARTRTVLRYEQARLEVHRLATTDELTGLANQRGLLEVAGQLPGKGWRSAARTSLWSTWTSTGSSRSTTRMGHAAGDALIRSVADVLRGAFRPRTPSPGSAATSSRSCSAVADPQFAQALVDRVHEHLAEVGVSASIGTAISTPGAREVDLADLLEQADAAMYPAKAARKNGQA